MRPTPRPARAAAFGLTLGAALLTIPASAAHAQFGKLVKRAAAAAAEAAGGSATSAAAEKAGLPAGRSGGRDVSKLDITPERLDAFVVAMRGPAEAARQRAAATAAREARAAAESAYREKDRAYDACKDRVTGGRTPDMSPAAMQRVAPAMDRFHAVNGRYGAAAAAGNTRLVAQLADSVSRAAAAMEDAMFPGLTRQCGLPPAQLPPAPALAEVDEAAFRPAVPAGMTPLQFGVLRERVAAWLVAGGVGAALSDGETQALESRRAALAPLAPYFKGRQLDWVNVGGGLDLK